MRRIVAAGLAVAVLSACGGDDDASHEPTTSASSTVDTTPPTTPSAAPSSTGPSTTAIPTTVGPVDECADVPVAPVWLFDGSTPGELVRSTGDDGLDRASWGTDGDGIEIRQIAGTPVDRSLIESSKGGDQYVSVSEPEAAAPDQAVEVAVTAAAGSDEGTFVADIASADCVRRYEIGPGLRTEAVVEFARRWLVAMWFDDRITIRDAGPEVCVDVPGNGSSCLPRFLTDARPEIGLLGVEGGDVMVLHAVVPIGTVLDPVSTRSRRLALEGTEQLMLVDIVSSEFCGTITLPEGDPVQVGQCATAAGGEPVAAITGDGDAVVVDPATGETTVLLDGPDPDDPPPAEGDVDAIDAVAISPGGTTAIVGTCCEPGVGTLHRVDLATGETGSTRFGHLPSFTDGGNLVLETLGTIVIADAAGQDMSTYEPEGEGATVIDLASLDEIGIIVSIEARVDGTWLVRRPAGGGDMVLSRRISPVTWAEQSQLSLAGSSTELVFVLDDASDQILAFDAASLEPVPEATEQVDWISAWIEGGANRFVDSQRRLFLGDAQVPGEFVWVR